MAPCRVYYIIPPQVVEEVYFISDTKLVNQSRLVTGERSLTEPATNVNFPLAAWGMITMKEGEADGRQTTAR